MLKMTVVAFIASVACAGCSSPERSPPAEPSTPSQETKSTSTWKLEASATAGAALVNTGEDGVEVMRLACRRNPNDLYAALPTLTRINSEDRLTIGVGEALATLVVSMEGPDMGLVATGQPQPAMMDAFLGGKSVGISYGARQLTLPGPPRAISEAFAEACRKAS